MTRPLVVANWKMNGLRRDGLDLARTLSARAKRETLPCDVALCPPATLLMAVREALDGSGIVLGGQDCHRAQPGAHTGDIGATMLRDVGCDLVIVGHSERRAAHRETDAQVAEKAAAALAAGMEPVICVGESAEDRDAGRAVAVVQAQIAASVPAIATASDVVFAYEPIWAIGTGRVPTLDDIAEIHRAIRETATTLFSGGINDLRVLYGGSVKGSNAADILATEGVNGALVGGASLDAEDFWAICRAAA